MLIGCNISDNKNDAKRSKYEQKLHSSLQTTNVTHVSQGTKYILYYYGRVEGWFPHRFGKDISDCPVSDCVLTTNRTLLGSHGNFDAVVVGNALSSILWNGTRYSRL